MSTKKLDAENITKKKAKKKRSKKRVSAVPTIVGIPLVVKYDK